VLQGVRGQGFLRLEFGGGDFPFRLTTKDGGISNRVDYSRYLDNLVLELKLELKVEL